MKLVIRTVLFHFLCIIVFGIIYYNIQSQFQHNSLNERRTIFDYILLSTTIQASVGIPDIYPITPTAKLLLILQQLLLIMTHVFTIYVFNL
jgi:hypothetical protein